MTARLGDYGTIGVVLAALAGASYGVQSTLWQPIPVGEVTGPSEVMTKELYKSVCFDCWEDTGAIYWVYSVVVGRSVRAYREILWDRDRDFVQVREGDVDVQLSLETDQVLAYRQGLPVVNPRPLVQRAIESFYNDRFWLYPVASFESQDVSRSGAYYKGELALRVDYKNRSFSPGDTYLWFIDGMGLPYGWKMWVKEVPIKGMWVTFENWTTLQTGMKVSTKHKGISTTISLEDVHGTYDFIGMDFDDDPFMLLDSRVQSN